MHADCALFVNRLGADERPDLMYHTYQIPFTVNTERLGYPVPEYAICMTPNVPMPRSVGRLWLLSANPDVKPALDFGYFTDPDGYDTATIVDGLELARQVAASSPFGRWLKREVAPGPALAGRQALSRYGRAVHHTVYHPAGTCTIGAEGDDRAGGGSGVAGARLGRAADRRRLGVPEHAGGQPDGDGADDRRAGGGSGHRRPREELRKVPISPRSRYHRGSEESVWQSARHGMPTVARCRHMEGAMAYVVTAFWRAKEGEDGAVERALQALSLASRQETGCLGYQAHRAVDDPRQFMIYEQYVDATAFDAHVASPHFARYGREDAIPRLEHRERVAYTTLPDA